MASPDLVLIKQGKQVVLGRIGRGVIQAPGGMPIVPVGVARGEAEHPNFFVYLIGYENHGA